MDVICIKCGEDVLLKDILGTIHEPYCIDCWNEHWKGKEEEFIFHILNPLETKSQLQKEHILTASH